MKNINKLKLNKDVKTRYYKIYNTEPNWTGKKHIVAEQLEVEKCEHCGCIKSCNQRMLFGTNLTILTKKCMRCGREYDVE